VWVFNLVERSSLTWLANPFYALIIIRIANMKTRLGKIFPTLQEVILAAVLSAIIMLLANSRQLLSYYGLQASDEVIKTSAGNVFSDALKQLDSFSATSSVVTFLIWAVVGIICFALVESLSGAYQELRLERQISSNRYVHPTNFSTTTFWRGVFVNAFSLLIGLVLLAVVTILFMLIVLPSGLAYSRSFLFEPNLANAVYLLVGLAVMSVGLLLIDIVVRYLLNRRRIRRSA
jgi:hypothetical protein